MCNLYWKMKFLKLADYIGYVIAKLLKYVEINMQTFSDSYLQKVLQKSKKNLKIVSRAHFCRVFWWIFSYQVSYQTVVSSQII